jgi:non-heme chloroperoxidase
VKASAGTRHSVTFTAADGARLAYHTSGQGPPSVVMVHGWMTSSRVWDALLGELAGANVGILTVDLRGAGASARGAHGLSLAGFAEDVRAAADHARLERFHLVGHSMGGQIAQLVAAEAPGRVRSLALLNPVPLAGLSLPDGVARSFRGAGGRRADFDGIFTAACRELPPLERAALIDEALAIAPAIIAETFEAWSRGVAAAALPAIAARTMVLATDDPFLPAQLLADTVVARIPGADLLYMAGPGHYPQVERPSGTAARLTTFWGRA